jgi:hypothetical protein
MSKYDDVRQARRSEFLRWVAWTEKPAVYTQVYISHPSGVGHGASVLVDADLIAEALRRQLERIEGAGR